MNFGVLPDHQIEWLSVNRSLIDPFNLDQLQPASYDVRIGPILQVPNNRGIHAIDLGNSDTLIDRMTETQLSDGFAIQPHRFVLASTQERVSIPHDIVGRIEGKSSLARFGLQIHSAGYLDPGFCGNVTLELVNFFDIPIILRPDVLIGQFSFEWMADTCREPKRGHYQNSDGTITSRYDARIKKSKV